MKKNITGWIIGAVAAVVVAAVIVVLSQQQSHAPQPTAPTPEASAPPSTSNDQATAPQTTTITYTNSGFSPATYTVKTGDTVTVENKSSHDLQFSSDNHPTHTAEPELNMNVLRPGESGTFTVTKAGTWGFHNHLDAQHTGELVVKA